MAEIRRQARPGLMLHSDRGVQYRLGGYQEALEAYKTLNSMNRQGNWWAKAVTESFFSRLKVELVYAGNFKSADEVSRCLFGYIEVFYNLSRRHSSTGYQSLAQKEEN